MQRYAYMETEARRSGERRSRKKKRQDLRRKIFGFCLFTFILGVLCGRIVFAKGSGEGLAEYGFWADEEPEDSKDGEGEEVEGFLSAGSSFEGGQKAQGENGWNLVLVNWKHAVEDGYEPPLAEIENNYYFDARAVEYLQKMLADGRKEGLDFWICSAYRTIEKQTNLFEQQVRDLMAAGLDEEDAREKAATSVAYPGTSEHNLGLAVDIVARDYQILDDKQADTDEAQWLLENCWKYGFILRYPTDKTEITGIIFEPWHYRYVGEKAAKEIMERGITLEEYLGQQ